MSMDNFYRYISIGFYFLIPLGVLALIISIVYRKIRGKNIYSAGTSFVGEYMFSIWEPKGKKAAVEEMQYMREDQREEADSGDPSKKGDDFTVSEER